MLGLWAQWNTNSSSSSPGALTLDGEADIKHALKGAPDRDRAYGGGGGGQGALCVCVCTEATVALDRVTQGSQRGHVTSSSLLCPLA